MVELIQDIEFPSLASSSSATTTAETTTRDSNHSIKSKKREGGGVEENNLVNSKKKARVTETSSNLEKRRRIPIIADMMGGVGPFSIPLAKLGLFKVYSNGNKNTPLDWLIDWFID